jgi:hypothetical protein
MVGAIAILTAILLFFPAQGHARQQSFEAGQWLGAATFDDNTGGFQHCRIEATYNNGITLAFGLLSDFTLLIVLTNPAWTLRDDVQFPLQLAVDRRWSKSVSGTALAPNGVYVSLGDDWEAFEALRGGGNCRSWPLGRRSSSF